jgi:uncharacterized protein YfbU (UPF0304 family)
MRLDERAIANVDGWRAKQSDLPSRAEAIRRLIDLGLARNSGDTIKFSDGERLIVSMLVDISQHLKIKDGIDHEFMAEAIFGGHSWALRRKFMGLFPGYEDDPRDVAFVGDVLDMWDRLESGYAKLSKKDKERVAKEAEPWGDVHFTGFDGNTESALMSIARFRVDKMEHFPRFKGRDLNSHLPCVDTYRRMLGEYTPISRNLGSGDPGLNQIISILKAAKYPE